MAALAPGVLAARAAGAQDAGPSAWLSGLVTTASGVAVRGARVLARHQALASEAWTETDAHGTFTIPALHPGAHTLTISVPGQRTLVLLDVQADAGTVSSVRAVMLSVDDGRAPPGLHTPSEIVQERTASPTASLTTGEISRLPNATRDVLDLVAGLPGVHTTADGPVPGMSGLSFGATAITVDGIGAGRGDGQPGDAPMERIAPRSDAIEAVTVSSLDIAGGVRAPGQIRLVTRSGTSRFNGSLYQVHEPRHDNSSPWFEQSDAVPLNRIASNTWGLRLGGPAVKDRLFYFANLEGLWRPLDEQRKRTVLTGEATAGLFTYDTAGGGTHTVSLWTVATANGVLDTPDPTLVRLLADIQATLPQGSIGATGNPITRSFTFINRQHTRALYPTARVDWNVAAGHRAGVSFYRHDSASRGAYAPPFPGFPNSGGELSTRWSLSMNLRSTLTSRVVNELRAGKTGGRRRNAPEVTAAQFRGTSLGNLDGFAVTFPIVANPWVRRDSETRETPTTVIEDTVNLAHGSHAISFGGSFTETRLDRTHRQAVPTVSLGLDGRDAANAMFGAAAFPGASAADLADARALYALLVGRVTAVSAPAPLDASAGRYVYLGDDRHRARARDFALFVQDSWRPRSNLTLQYGIGYELQFPFTPFDAHYTRAATVDDVWGVSGIDAGGRPNLFRPGAMTGQPTRFVPYRPGEQPYATEWNNVTPRIGVSWRPALDGRSPLAAIVGTAPVLRGACSLAFLPAGIGAFDEVFASNAGGSLVVTRTLPIADEADGAAPLPALFRDKSALGPPPFEERPAYPLAGSFADAVHVFDPDTRLPSAHSFTVGLQRAIGKHGALEIRYVGTRQRGGWIDGGRNVNEVNLLENGFLEEFRLAQVNLQANVAAGRGASFRYHGPGTGTSPLPIYLAYLSGIPDEDAGDPARYTSSAFSSAGFYGPLAIRSPDPASAAEALHASPVFRANALRAGLPANFFYANPGLGGGAYLTGRREDGRRSRYDAILAEARRRLSRGLVVQASYQAVLVSRTSAPRSLRAPREDVEGREPTHTFKITWVYELPFGVGRRFGSGLGRVANALVGGWGFSGKGVIDSGNRLDFGNVRLVNMTDDELRASYAPRIVTDAQGGTRVYLLPQDVIDNTIKAFRISATSQDGYSALGAPGGRYLAPMNGADCIEAYSGSCGLPRHHYVTGPARVTFDMSVSKQFDVGRGAFIELSLEVFNVFANVNIIPRAAAGTALSVFEVSETYGHRRHLQLSSRFTW